MGETKNKISEPKTHQHCSLLAHHKALQKLGDERARNSWHPTQIKTENGKFVECFCMVSNWINSVEESTSVDCSPCDGERNWSQRQFHAACWWHTKMMSAPGVFGGVFEWSENNGHRRGFSVAVEVRPTFKLVQTLVSLMKCGWLDRFRFGQHCLLLTPSKKDYFDDVLTFL